MDKASEMAPEKQPATDEKPDIRSVLMQKRTRLLSQLKQCDSVMAKLQQEYAARLSKQKDEQRPLQEALQHVEALLLLEGWEGPEGSDGQTGKPLGPELISYIDAAYQLLEKTGQPTHYRTILERLQEKGVYIPGSDPAATLLAKMSRDRRFKRIRKRGTYALSFWRFAAAKKRRG